MTPLRSVRVPRFEASVGAQIHAQAERFRNKSFLALGDVTHTFEEFERESNRVALGFEHMQLRGGATVCVLLPNCLEFLLAFAGLAKIGAITVAINTEFSGANLARLINLSKATTVVLDRAFEPALAGVAESLTDVTHLIYVGEGHSDNPRLSRFHASGWSELPRGDGTYLEKAIQPSDPVALLCTSGTTGLSKAVELSHRYVLNLGAMTFGQCRLKETDVLYTCYPLFHGEALVLTVVAALVGGATVAVAPRFSASRYWADIRRYKATFTTMMGAVAAILDKCAPEPDDADNTLRLIMCAPVPPMWQEFEKRFAVKLAGWYGATECGVPVWADVEAAHIAGSCGRVVEEYELQIMDDADVPVADGQVGEIVVRPKLPFIMMNRYFADPAATVQVWRNLWYHTGDRGYLSQGYLYYVGRSRDAIRRRGENISLFEVETAIEAHPAVLEAAVIGVPSEFTEEEVKAVVVLRADAVCEPGEIFTWAEARLPKYARPRFLEFVIELPKSSTGKVQKDRLRAAWRTPTTFDLAASAYCGKTR